ncbi:MAG: serine/threonine-protein kinase [Acidobacteriota bacterium]
MSATYAPGTILGSYRIEDVLGEGGMGIVYLATHTRLGRRVAIKVLRPEYTSDPRALARFFGEARSVNKIAHQNIIEVTDFVEQPGADNYYVMELLEGVSLAELVSLGGMLELPRSLAIMTQLAQALAAVHRAGIVHRDVKPHNVILIQRDGRADFVKLVDFGVAKLVGSTDEPVAAETSIFGTPRYMAPEHRSGAAVDHRADIFSFGVMFHELVTGELPKPGVLPGQIAGLPHTIPHALEAVIVQCTSLDPAGRPRDLDDVAERLLKIQRTLAVPAPTPVHADATVGVQAPAPRRRRWWIVALVALAPLAGAAAVLAWHPQRHDPPAAAGSSAGSGSNVAAQVAAELAKADQRIADGRFVANSGDDALAHLLAARALDPGNAGVRDRLHAIATKYQQLADQALAAGSLAEAAAELQTVVSAEPDNAAAAAKMHEVEDLILNEQRTGSTR